MDEKIYEVRGLSMTGVIEPGDTVRVSITTPVKRNDLVVFSETGFIKDQQVPVSIKKCYGIPGDKITFNSETGEMWVNGVLCPVMLQNEAQKYCWKDWLRFESNVPKDHLFLLGNIDDAVDSRKRGYFSLDQVLGPAEKV